MKSAAAREADLFFAELMGESLPAEDEAFVPPSEDNVEALNVEAMDVEATDVEATDPDPMDDPSARWSPDRPEPFFGDTSKHCWKVAARPGKRLFGELRPDDLIVRRAGKGWRCTLGEEVDSDTVFLPGGRRVRRNVVVLRRVRKFRMFREKPPDLEAEFVESGDLAELDIAELNEVCGFFGANNVRRTEQQMRDAVVARATAEWTSWHSAANAPRSESDIGMFGRLVGYYLAATRDILPDALTAMQAGAALSGINYAALLAPAATPAVITTEVTRITGLLVAAAPGGNVPGLSALVGAAIRQAREANTNTGAFSAWSAVFVSTCGRGAGVTQGLEAVIPPGRTHFGKDALLRPSTQHVVYTIEARTRRAARPRKNGYHAFTPAERAPQLGDIIVQDRRPGITAAQVFTLAGLTDGMTHGDIVIEVQPTFVVTIGGNLGDSSRKRRYPRNAQGFLAVDDPRQQFVQEDNAGVLPALPNPPAPPIPATARTQPLAGQSTARIFALLSLVEECAVVPGQPYGGGVLT